MRQTDKEITNRGRNRYDPFKSNYMENRTYRSRCPLHCPSQFRFQKQLSLFPFSTHRGKNRVN
jgi:hypothetical protein